MEKLYLVAITLILACVFSIEGRPQVDMNDVVQVDGFSFDGPADRTNPTVTDFQPVISTEPSPISRSTTASPQLDRCIQMCLATSEFNPVCGTDGVVYSNPGRLTCAQQCGKDVRLLFYGPCSTSNARG